MAFTRKMLAAMGIDPEKIEEIMAAHVEVVTALKDERDTLKADADKLAAVQTELDALKQVGGDWKQKYETEHGAFEEYKASVAAADTRRKKSDVYREAMRKANIPEKVLDALVKIANVDSVVFSEDGTVTNMVDVEKAIKETFSDYIMTESTVPDKPDTPPAAKTGKDAFDAMSLAEQMRYANEHPDEVQGYLNS